VSVAEPIGDILKAREWFHKKTYYPLILNRRNQPFRLALLLSLVPFLFINNKIKVNLWFTLIHRLYNLVFNCSTQIFSSKEVADRLAKIKDTLSNTAIDWEKRVDAVSIMSIYFSLLDIHSLHHL